jgi:hypothetical protein
MHGYFYQQMALLLSKYNLTALLLLFCSFLIHKSLSKAATATAQAAFGLCREDALKIQPRWSDQSDCLQLKDIWGDYLNQ